MKHSNSTFSALVKRVSIEILIWYSLPLAFITIYIFQFHNPARVVFDHLRPITHIALTVFLLKTCLLQWVKSTQTRLFLSAWLYGTSLFFLMAYYGLVLIGLRAWSKVITTELIASYVGQATPFIEVMGLSYNLVILATTIVYLAMCGICFYVTKRYFNYGPMNLPHIPKKYLDVFIFTIFAVNAFFLYRYFFLHELTKNEPFLITVNAGKAGHGGFIDTTRISFNHALDQEELITRNTYLPSNTVADKNVILIVVDALRSDHMGVYGYGRNNTPFLSQLAKDGRITAVPNVRAACSLSLCGLSSISSSKYVHQLPNKPFTLHQVLKQHGYQINMILGGDHTNFYNLRDFYGAVDNYYDGSMAKPYYMNDDALVTDKVGKLPAWNGTPVMFQFHLMTAHNLGRRLKNQHEPYKPSQPYIAGFNRPPRIEHTNYYDNGVFQIDSIIKELLTSLEKKSYLENALVIVTADHGEGLGEHNRYGHGNSVYEELLRIPLLIIDYGKDTTKKQLFKNAHSVVSQIDIATTILHDLKIPKPKNWSGIALQDIANISTGTMLTSTTNTRNGIVYFQLHPFIGLYDYQNPNQVFKYWVHTFTNEEFAYDITSDANETTNLIPSLPTSQRNLWRSLAYQTRIE